MADVAVSIFDPQMLKNARICRKNAGCWSLRRQVVGSCGTLHWDQNIMESLEAWGILGFRIFSRTRMLSHRTFRLAEQSRSRASGVAYPQMVALHK